MHPSGYRALAASGTEYARRVLRGEPALGVPIGSFALELGLALRPHFFALPSIAALAGAAPFASKVSFRIVLAALVAGLGWGVGQLLNDLLDRETDQVNAPDRGIASGRLPPGPALAAALGLGAALAVGTALVHPRAWVLAIASAVLIALYNATKRVPLLGNLALGALLATAAAIGASAARADRELSAIAGGWRSIALTSAIAAWYLQANYEKDRPGDRAAGYRTLAVVLSIRTSALLRAFAIVAIAWIAFSAGTLPGPIAASTMVAAAAIGVGSTLGPIRHGTDEAALAAYRAAVVASILALLALAAPLLGRGGTAAVLVAALALVWFAFFRSPNP
jgi:4-hydroxybenzoate polyprenyltransferase